MAQPRKLGHAVLRVRDLKRSEEFYTKIVGLKVNDRGGDMMVFMKSASDVHHDLAIAKLGDDAPGPEQTRVGLYHLAFELSSFAEVEEVYRLVKETTSKLLVSETTGITRGCTYLTPTVLKSRCTPTHPSTRTRLWKRFLPNPSARPPRSNLG